MYRTAIVAIALISAMAWQTSLANSGATLELKEPRGIDVDSVDRIVVAYAGSHVVAVYTPDGQIVRLLGRSPLWVLSLDPGQPPPIALAWRARGKGQGEIAYLSEPKAGEETTEVRTVCYQTTEAAWRFRFLWFLSFGGGDADQ